MKLHRFKRILKKDELLTIEAYANDKVNAVLDKINAEINDEAVKTRNADKRDGLYIAREIVDRYR